MFADGLDVGERLAGMIEIAEGVDHWHARTIAAALRRSLQEDAGDEAIDPAVEIAGDVFEGSRTPMGPSRKTIRRPSASWPVRR